MALLRSGTRIYGNATIDTNLVISGTTAATSNSSGALQVSGGIGLVGNVYTTANVYANNITASNLLNATDAVISGNLTVNGSTIYANVTSLTIKDPIIEQGGNTSGGALTSNDSKDRGQLLHYYSSTAVDAFMGWDNSNAEFAFGSNVSVTNEVVTFNTYGNLRAGYFLGNGSGLTSITGANVTGEVSYAAAANSVAGANVSGAVSYATTANSVAGANVSGAVAYATTANSVAGANVSGQVGNSLVAGTVYTNAQPNITSVGSLTGLTVSNATGVVDFTTTANVTLGNIANLHISGGTADYILKTDGAGNLSWTAPPSAGSGGVLTSTVDTFTATGSGNTYTLTVTPDSKEQVFINLDGVVQLKSSYTLTGNVITLLGTPESGAIVEATTMTGAVFTGSAVGSNTQIQFNDAGNTAGSANLTFNKTTSTLNATNITANGTPVATTGKAIAMSIVFGF